jgi:3-phenylpropionate/cinnamic acid dioxygenase small subunit
MATDALVVFVEKQSVTEVLIAAGTLLDSEDFDGWLGLFDEVSEYEMSAYSQEIRKHMSWWKSDRVSLEKILKEIPRHVRDPGRDVHIVTPTHVQISDGKAAAKSNFAVFRTAPDGETRLYVVGRYEDMLVKRQGRWLYSAHKAVLQTRLLEGFTHVPL